MQIVASTLGEPTFEIGHLVDFEDSPTFDSFDIKQLYHFDNSTAAQHHINFANPHGHGLMCVHGGPRFWYLELSMMYIQSKISNEQKGALLSSMQLVGIMVYNKTRTATKTYLIEYIACSSMCRKDIDTV